MNINRIGPIYKYKLKETVMSIVIFYSIMVLVIAALIAGTINFSINTGGSSSSSFTGFGMAASIFMFIIGIVTIREDLRLFVQNGRSRKTVFLIQTAISASTAVVLSVMGELLILLARAAAGTGRGISISDIYYLVFSENNINRNIYLIHLESIAMYIAMFLAACAFGVFISLMFYRLSKLWTVIVAVGVPVFTFVGLPLLVSYLRISLSGPVRFFLTEAWYTILFLVFWALVFELLSWLLLRRAPVKAAAG